MSSLTLVLTLAAAAVANPYAPDARPVVLDLRPGAVNAVPLLPGPDAGATFADLAAHEGRPVVEKEPGSLPPGWVQLGGMVVPEAVANGAPVISPFAARPEVARSKVEGPGADDLCAYPDAVPGGVYPGEFRRGTEYPRRGTIYMNYTGGVLYNGMGDNSAENWSALAKTGSQYPVYTGGEERAIAVAQAVQADFAAWALRVVYLARPPKVLPYVMIMMGGHYSDTVAGPSGGVAPGADCEDLGLRNVCYAFVNNDSTSNQANVASQEIGHTMGLGHTEGNDRVMAFGYDTYAPIDMGFGAECTPTITVQGQSGACVGVNKCHCNEGELQDDTRTLSAIYAPPGPDVVPPEIAITAPEDGAVFQEGDAVTVKFEPWDDYGGYGWKLLVKHDGALVADVVDYNAALEFTLSNLPSGSFELTALVMDQADQTAEHTITITVEGTAAPTTSAGETDSDSDGDTDASTDASTGETDAASETGDSSSDSDGTPADGADDSCACQSDGAPAGAAWGLLALLGLRRRRGA
ncbi:MYXO-CTERM sorting domain-containing protein [Nannocystis bainbridge]|uniref:MYXO-CTERM sorting domain-containing protein n=1 Tax=Nannocystis bainbridge TaxID=2995303 RepID=A0ABT5DWB5_9BACT|nr:MYXO-CTERM sorting domain-containing protein [Nannocystis bainbridge]MDC0717384.1 MYXO-CTERM sorting domain-containing protein [Nannocystis bainbridge]